jgi:hypothetical protein
MIASVSRQKLAGSRKAAFIFCFSLSTLGFISCTTLDPKYTEPSRVRFEETLNAATNKMTYDEALMTWGEPASVFQGDEIFIATWGSAESGGAIFPIGNTWFALPIEKGWKLQLSFSKTTRKMVSWNYNKW